MLLELLCFPSCSLVPNTNITPHLLLARSILASLQEGLSLGHDENDKDVHNGSVRIEVYYIEIRYIS